MGRLFSFMKRRFPNFDSSGDESTQGRGNVRNEDEEVVVIDYVKKTNPQLANAAPNCSNPAPPSIPRATTKNQALDPQPLISSNHLMVMTVSTRDHLSHSFSLH